MGKGRPRACSENARLAQAQFTSAIDHLGAAGRSGDAWDVDRGGVLYGASNAIEARVDPGARMVVPVGRATGVWADAR